MVVDVDPPPPVEGVVAERPTVTDQTCPAEVDHDPSDEPAPESTGDVHHQVPPLDTHRWANGARLQLLCVVWRDGSEGVRNGGEGVRDGCEGVRDGGDCVRNGV